MARGRITKDQLTGIDASVFSKHTISVNENGYIYIGSLLLQWGVLSNVALNQTFHQVVFNTPFTDLYNIQASLSHETTVNGSIGVVIKKSSINNSWVEIAADHSNESATGDIHWFAIGLKI